MVKEKEWLSVEDIQKKVNSLDITRKEISKERIREVLKEIEKRENNDLFRTIKDPNQTKKGRKRILYSKNFIPRVIEYFHEGFYFPNNQRLANAISKLLLTPLKVENSLPSSIKRSFRDFPQDKINFERRGCASRDGSHLIMGISGRLILADFLHFLGSGAEGFRFFDGIARRERERERRDQCDSDQNCGYFFHSSPVSAVERFCFRARDIT